MAEQIGIKLALDGAGAVQSGLRGVSDALGNLGVRSISVADAFRSLGPAIAATFSAGAITAWARGAVNAIDAMNDLADATGATVEQVSALDSFARRTGTTLDNVGGILVKFNAALNQTNGADNGVSQALRAIGLDTAALKKQDPVQALQATAQALSKFADDGNKARLVQELFGKSIREAAPVLKDLAEAGKLNATVTSQQAAEAERFNRALATFKANSEDAGRAIVMGLLPSLSNLINQLKDGTEVYKSFWSAAIDVGLRVNPFKSLNENLVDTVAEIKRTQDIIEEIRSNPLPDLLGRRARAIAEYQQQLGLAQAREQYLLRQMGREGGGRGTPPSASGGRNAPSVPTLGPAAEQSAIRNARQQYRADFLRSEKNVYQELDAERQRQLEEARKRDAGYAEYQLQLQDEVTQALMDGEAYVTRYMQDQEQARLAELKIRAQQELANIQRVDQAQTEADAAAARAAQLKLESDARESLLQLQRYDEAVSAAEEAYRKQAAGYVEYVQTLSDENVKSLIDLQQYESDWLKRDDEERRKREGAYAEYQLQLQDEVTRTQIADAQAVQRYLDDNTESRTRALQTIGDRINQMQLEAQAAIVAADHNISLAEAIELVTIARLREQQARYREGSEGYKAIEAEINARRQLRALMSDQRVREENERAAREAADAWSRTVDQISQSLADGLMNGGLKAGEAIKRYFQTLILQPIIRAVVDPVARSVTSILGLGTASAGAAAQGAGAAAGGGAGGSNLLGMLGVSNSTLGIYGELFKSTGQLAMSGWGGSMQALGHAINAPLGQGLAMGAGTIAGTLGPIAIGQMLGRGISGGYSALGGRSGSTAVNMGTALGALWGPLGAGIGAAIGGIANRLFGTKLTEQGITGTFGGEQGFAGNSYTFEKGGVFARSRTRTGELDPTMNAMLGQAFGALRSSTQAMADTLGASGDAVRKFTSSIKLNLLGLSEQQVTQRLQEEMTKLAEALANAALGTREYTRLGETQAQALTRLSGALSTVNAALDLLNRTTLSASLQSADLASKLADLFGGDQALSSAVGAYQQAFYSESERTAIATRQVTEALNKLGFALPATRAQFRAIVEAQDLNTEAGRKMFAALLQVAPAVDKVTAGIDTLAGRLGTLAAQLVADVQSALQQQITASQAAANAARQAADAYRGASTSLLDTARALRGQSAPGMSAAAAYRAGLSAAQGGDVTAMQGLSGLAQSYAESLRGSATSRAQYLAGTRGIAAELEAVAGTAGGLATQRSVQAALLDVNTAALQTLAEDLQRSDVSVELLQQHQVLLGQIAQQLSTGGPIATGLATLDRNVDGLLTFDELRAGLDGKATDQQLGALMRRVDANGDGQITQLELVAASVDAQGNAQRWWLEQLNHQIWAGFGALDKTADGLLTFDELRTGLAGKATDDEIRALIRRADANADAQISKAEALRVLQADSARTLAGVDQGTSGVVEAQQKAGDLLASSDTTLARVLAKLGQPDANLAVLADRVQTGNALIADRLSSVVAAIGAQTAAQQAEVKRQQDLIKAQSDLKSAAGYLGTLQADVATAQATLAGTSATTSVRVGTRYDWLGMPKGGIYEERANPAYQTAIDAVNAAQQALAVYAPQVDQLRELIRSLGGVPAFAAGGLHTGGLRLVGERGPELEATGPARYWSAADTTAMLGNGQRRDEALVAEIRALRQQVARLEAAQVQTAVNTGKTQRLMQRVTRDGESMQVTDVTTAP